MARKGNTRGGPTSVVPERMTKAERREQARRERQELLRKQAHRRRRRRIGVVVGSVVVAAAVAVGVVLAATHHAKKGPLPGLLTTQATAGAPWPANNQKALERADAIGLPPLPSGFQSFHHHDLLQVLIHGQTIPVPAQIGLTSSAGASMHTHDASGIMHIESGRQFDYTLSDFFDVWGVRFTKSCIGGWCSSGADRLRVFLNGKPYPGDPTKLPLSQHDDVVVTFGTTSELPNPIPSTYSVNISQSCTGSC